MAQEEVKKLSPLDLKKLQVELIQVQAARASQELRIAEHQDNIDRLQVAIKVQLDKETELTQKLAEQASLK